MAFHLTCINPYLSCRMKGGFDETECLLRIVAMIWLEMQVYDKHNLVLMRIMS